VQANSRALARVHSVIQKRARYRWTQTRPLVGRRNHVGPAVCTLSLVDGRRCVPCCCLLRVREQVGIWFVDRVQVRIWFACMRACTRREVDTAGVVYVQGAGDPCRACSLDGS
jgi:hypothetical protein